MTTKISPVSIPQMAGVSRTRFFAEVQTRDGRWHDVGNCETETEARELLGSIRLVGESSWMQS